MIIIKDEVLAKHTTIKVGGVCNQYYIPERLEDVIELSKRCTVKFIGGGSNLLINERVFEEVADLGHFDRTIEQISAGKFRVGASVRLQVLLNEINNAGFGGIEYLCSVPGLVGGAVAMNAGRGKDYNQSLSDYIVSVDALKAGVLFHFSKEQCKFEYRNSLFKKSDYIITSAVFQFPLMSIEESAKKKRERIDLVRKVQDNSYPNFGSVFDVFDPGIIKFARFLRIGNRKVHFSGKTNNWILNNGGSFQEVCGVIKKVEIMHRLLRKKVHREIVTIQSSPTTVGKK